MTNHRFSRIEAVLAYLHQHLYEPHTVASLAEVSCWSRWQFQRVFSDTTGLSVAQYIRELRLSQAAVCLLESHDKHLDIALAHGFDSEIGFHRAFKQYFHCTPGEYRKRGKRIQIKTPLTGLSSPTLHDKSRFTQIRIETRPSFQISGLVTHIFGPFAEEPNFRESIPKLWRSLDQKLMHDSEPCAQFGIIDTLHIQEDDALPYWAGVPKNTSSLAKDLTTIDIPEQEYAVIPVKGDARQIESAFMWCIQHWLPNSQYRGINGFELEIYPSDYQADSNQSYMEYWLPVTPRHT